MELEQNLGWVYLHLLWIVEQKAFFYLFFLKQILVIHLLHYHYHPIRIIITTINTKIKLLFLSSCGFVIACCCIGFGGGTGFAFTSNSSGKHSKNSFFVDLSMLFGLEMNSLAFFNDCAFNFSIDI